MLSRGPFTVWWPLSLSASFANFPFHAEQCRSQQIFLMSGGFRIVSLCSILTEREIPWRQALLLPLLPLSGFCRQHLYSQWSLFPTWGHTFQIPVSSTSLMTEATPFPGLPQEVWQEPPRKWWLAHEQTPQMGPRDLRGQHLDITLALNFQSWAPCLGLKAGWTQVI